MRRPIYYFFLLFFVSIIFLNTFSNNVYFNDNYTTSKESRDNNLVISGTSAILNVSERSVLICHERGCENATIFYIDKPINYKLIIIYVDDPLKYDVSKDVLGFVKPNNSADRYSYILNSNSSIFLVSNDTSEIIVKLTGLEPNTRYDVKILDIICFFDGKNVKILKIVNDEILSFDTLGKELTDWKSPFLIPLALSAGISLLVIFLVSIVIHIRKKNPALYYLLPILIIFIIIDLIPIIFGFLLSFMEYSMDYGETPKFVGFGNYEIIFKNNLLPIVLTTSIVWGLLSTSLRLIISFGIAYSIRNSKKSIKNLIMIILFISWITPSYILLTSWRAIIFGSLGDSLFKRLFGIYIDDKVDKYGVFLISIFIDIITNLFFDTLAFLTALSSIKKELIDSSKIDGIGLWERIRYVELPSIKHMIVPWILLDILKISSSFNVVFFITGGGPTLEYGISEYGIIGATTTISYFIFEEFYKWRRIGLAAAYSMIKSTIDISLFLIWYQFYREKREYKMPSSKWILLLFTLFSGIGSFIDTRYLGIFIAKPISLISALLVIPYLFKDDKKYLKIALIGASIEIIAYFYQLTIYEIWYAFDFSIIFAIPIVILYSPKLFDWPKFKNSDIEFRILIICIMISLIFAIYCPYGIIFTFLIILLLTLGRNDYLIFPLISICFLFILQIKPLLVRIIASNLAFVIILLCINNRKLTKIADIISKITVFSCLLLLELLPIFLVIKVSVDPNEDIFTLTFSRGITTKFYAYVIMDGILDAMLNSLIIALLTIVFSVIPAIFAAYAFSKLNVPKRDKFSLLLLLIKQLTGIVTITPLFLILATFDLTDSFLGVAIAQASASALYNMWLLIGFFNGIPKEIEDSALIDGIDKHKMLFDIYIPLSISMIGFIVLMSFIHSWNSYLFQYLLIFDEKKFTIPIKLTFYVGEPGTKADDWGPFAAASLISITPLLITYYFIFDKFVEKGSRRLSI